MKSFLPSIAIVLVLGGTLLGGWLHGQRLSPWSNDRLAAAADELKSPLPEQIGPWRRTAVREFSKEVTRMLQCPAHHDVTYLNDQTGDSIAVAIIVGPHGPVACHTPEICYSSQDYEITSQRQQMPLHDQAGIDHMLWELNLKPRDATRQPLRVAYAWGTGSEWQASDNPRFDFAGQPYLYKIQLAATDSGDRESYDPVHDFLSHLLPALAPHLLPTSGQAAAAAPPAASS